MIKQAVILLFCMLNWTAIFLALPPLLPLAAVIFAIKLLEEYFCEKAYGAEAMTAEENLWLRDGPTNWGIINVLMMLQGRAELSRLRLVIDSRLSEAKENNGKFTFPKARKYAWSGFSSRYWMPLDRIAVEDYVVEWSGSIPKTRNQLEDVVGQLTSTPLERDKALWKFTSIPYHEDGNEKTVLFFRGHHSMADGMSLAHFLIHQLPDNPPASPQILRKFSQKDRVFLTMWGVIQIPLICYKMLLAGMRQTLFCVTNLNGEKRFAWSKPISLDLVKSIKSELDVTVNDVLLGCLAQRIREISMETGKASKDLLTFFPVDLRADPSSARAFNNEFAIVQLSLPLSHDNPIDTTKEMKKRIDYLKTSGEPFAARLTTRLVQYWMPECLSGVLFWLLSRNATMVVSNVPGPERKLVIAGHPLEYLVFNPPQRYRVGTSCSIFSYAGNIYVGCAADAAVGVNPRDITDKFNDVVIALADRLGIARKESMI